MELYREFDFERKELERISKEQVKLREGIQSYEHKKNENVMVKGELDLLDENDVVYKLIGPVLVQQDTSDSKLQVQHRLELITKEMSKLDKTYKENELKIENKRKKMQDLQEKIITLSKQVEAMRQQQQQQEQGK